MTFVKSAPDSPSFRLERQGLDLHFRHVRLAQRQWLTPGYVRIRLEGADLRGFASLGCDDHLRIFFPEGPVSSVEELRAAPSREYTPLAWDADEGWLDLEFAIHDSPGPGQGVAAPWAATAEIGAAVGIGGPRGSMVFTGRPDAWLLAGDETAVPAMRRFAHLMDAEAVGRVFVEVADAENELAIDTPTGVVVEQVHRDGAPAGAALAARLDALTDADRPGDAPAGIFGFVAAEQAVVRHGRALLLERWGVPAEQTIVKGYWKRGEGEYHAPH